MASIDATWSEGRRVVVRFSGRVGVRRGVIVGMLNQWCVRLSDRKIAFLFFPHPTAHVNIVK